MNWHWKATRVLCCASFLLFWLVAGCGETTTTGDGGPAVDVGPAVDGAVPPDGQPPQPDTGPRPDGVPPEPDGPRPDGLPPRPDGGPRPDGQPPRPDGGPPPPNPFGYAMGPVKPAEPEASKNVLVLSAADFGSFGSTVRNFDLGSYREVDFRPTPRGPQGPRLGVNTPDGLDLYYGDGWRFVAGPGNTVFILGGAPAIDRGAALLYDFAKGEQAARGHVVRYAKGIGATAMRNGAYYEKGSTKVLYASDWGNGRLFKANVAGLDTADVDAENIPLRGSFGSSSDSFIYSFAIYNDGTDDWLYMLTRSSKDENIVHRAKIDPATGNLTFNDSLDLKDATNQKTSSQATCCGDPSLTIARFHDGDKYLFVGNDPGTQQLGKANVTVYNLSKNETTPQLIDIKTFGNGAINMKVHPDGSKLYVLPQQRLFAQEDVEFELPDGSKKSAKLNRYRVAVIDLAAGAKPAIDAALPEGIDLDYWWLKKWMVKNGQSDINSIGSMGPLTKINARQFTVSRKYLYLIGNNGVAGEGSAMALFWDMAVYDLGSGNGLMMRKWRDVKTPSDLDPKRDGFGVRLANGDTVYNMNNERRLLASDVLFVDQAAPAGHPDDQAKTPDTPEPFGAPLAEGDIPPSGGGYANSPLPQTEAASVYLLSSSGYIQGRGGDQGSPHKYPAGNVMRKLDLSTNPWTEIDFDPVKAGIQGKELTSFGGTPFVYEQNKDTRYAQFIGCGLVKGPDGLLVALGIAGQNSTLTKGSALAVIFDTKTDSQWPSIVTFPTTNSSGFGYGHSEEVCRGVIHKVDDGHLYLYAFDVAGDSRKDVSPPADSASIYWINLADVLASPQMKMFDAQVVSDSYLGCTPPAIRGCNQRTFWNGFAHGDKLYVYQRADKDHSGRATLGVAAVNASDGKLTFDPAATLVGGFYEKAEAWDWGTALKANFGGKAHAFLANRYHVTIWDLEASGGPQKYEYRTDSDALHDDLPIFRAGHGINWMRETPDGSKLVVITHSNSAWKDYVTISGHQETIDRHRAQVIDLSKSDAQGRPWFHAGVHNGNGLDMEYSWWKQWLIDQKVIGSVGMIPPIVWNIRGLAASNKTLFMIGHDDMVGGDGSALGFGGSLQAFDVDSGEGIFFRGYQYDGKNQCLWGYPLGKGDANFDDGGAQCGKSGEWRRVKNAGIVVVGK